MNSAIDYNGIKMVIMGILAMFIEARQGAKGFWEDDLYEFCCRQNPEIASLHITTFVEMVFSSLLKLRLPFGFQRVGIHSNFTNIRLKDNNGNAFMQASQSDFDDSPRFEGNDDAPVEHKRLGHKYKRAMPDSASTLEGAVAMLKKHVRLVDDAKVRVRNLKEKYEDMTGEDEADICPFSDVLDALIDETEGLELMEKVNEDTGKRRVYLKGIEII
jgi:hypothetical protein